MLETNVETVGNQERFINVRSLLVHSLLRWKIILAAALLACLFGGFREYSRQKALIASSASTEKTEEKEGLISDEDYNTLLERIDEQMAERFEYMSHSAFMTLNPYNSYISYVSYYVVSPEAGTVDYDSTEVRFTEEDRNAMALLTAVQDYITYGLQWTGEAEKYGAENDTYLRELINVNMDNNILRVTVFNNDKEYAAGMLEYILKAVPAKYQELQEKTGLDGYELVELDRNTESMMIGSYYNWYTNRLTEVENIVKNKNNFISNMKAENDVTEVITSVNKKKVLKKGIVFGVIGAVGAWMIVLAYLVLNGKVLSAEELNKFYHLTNISVLNSRRKGKKTTGITRSIYAMQKEGRSTLPDDTRLELADNMIRQLCPEASKIGLIGDVSSETMQEISSGLSALSEGKYVALDAIGSDVAQRKQLSEADAVILLAENEKTSYAAVDDLMRLAKNYNKPVIGSIVC